jgi:phosphotriesterase-related protein
LRKQFSRNFSTCQVNQGTTVITAALRNSVVDWFRCGNGIPLLELSLLVMNYYLSRRKFIKNSISLLLLAYTRPGDFVVTVNGRIPASAMGTTLVHEHFLVDFIGADKINYDRWNREEVIQKVLPYLLEAKKHGVKTMLDCTPAFLGRDVVLQRSLAKQSGLQVITNTGDYGAVGNKYLPPWAFTETPEQIAKRWISEFENGIEGTSAKPGFIKIGVDPGPLSELHQKLITAAAITHLRTGLTICSHTGKAIAAFEQIALLQKMNVHPSAFVWTHAQDEEDKSRYAKAAQPGAWISLDALGWGDAEEYAAGIDYLKQAGLLNKVLLSHDAGWYKPGEPDDKGFRGYTNIFEKLIPSLYKKGFTKNDIRQLLVKNPAEAFAIRVRRNK